MNVRLKEMKLRNFKGIKELDIAFNSLDTNIYGKNATGKTTIADAFSWLFFNKDSSGSADFDVKTKSVTGEYLHNLEHSVEAVLEIKDMTLNGGGPIETVFKKIFKEKYTKQRGSTTATFTGHTTDYFVDDVPRKKKEYDETVNQLFDSNIFPMITDPFYFNTRMKWQDRRKMLIEICGDVSDEIVISSNKELEPLSGTLNGKSVDDFRMQLKSQMKPINDELKAIPIKINEAQLAIPTNVGEFDDGQYQFLNDKINELEVEKRTALSGGAVADKEAELIKLKNRKLLLENEIPDVSKLNKEHYQFSLQKDDIQRKIQQTEMDIKAKKSMQISNEYLRDELREKYVDVKELTYDETKNICPACGQELQPDKIAKAVEDFNVYKSNELEKINDKGKNLMMEYKERENSISLLGIELERNQSLLKDIKAIVDEKQKEIDNAQEKFKKEQQPKIDEINIQIKDVEDQIGALKSNTTSVALQYDERITALKEEKARMDGIKASIKLAEVQKKRIEELEAREKQLADEYSAKDQMLYLTDLFIKSKVEMLTEKINSHFNLCEFSLFQEQINGGLNECCEVTVKGVNYSDLNNAMKINAGLDVINTICDYSNTHCPVFIDNAESVNQTIKTGSQQIRLYVTDTDETLRIENK